MLSDDDLLNAEINEMKNENPELEEYDQVFRKIKEALTIEIQSTKTKLLDKIHELNNKTEHQFNRLYNSCDKKVRRVFDSKYTKKNTNEDSNNIDFHPPKNVDISNSSAKINKNEKSEDDDFQLQTKQNQQIQINKSNQNKISSDDKKKSNNDNISSQEYDEDDDVIFGFLEGSEEESEFLE